MFGKVKPEHLSIYLSKIEKTFPEFVQGISVDLEHVNRYYDNSYFGYKLMHSWEGAIHMALSRDGKTFKKNDYFVQAEQVIAELPNKNPVTICELGCGKGFNVSFIGNNHPRRKVIGVDLNTNHIKVAKKKYGHIPNIEFHVDDFHDLERLEDQSIDLLFSIESLCHSTDLRQVLRAARSKTKKGAKLIVYDGYRSSSPIQNEDLARAQVYVEHAMAVPKFRTESEFIEIATKSGWRVTSTRDRSKEIEPNLVRLSDLAKGFFKITPITRIIKGLLPRFLVTNAIAGLLMPLTVKGGAHRYLEIVMEAE